jgi:hypothetical protein
LYCQELGEIINIIPFVLSGAWSPDNTNGIIFIISPSSRQYKWNNIYYLSKSLQAPDNTNGMER